MVSTPWSYDDRRLLRPRAQNDDLVVRLQLRGIRVVTLRSRPEASAEVMTESGVAS